MPNDGNYRTNKRYYSIGGDVSGILPLNEYRIQNSIAVDVQKLLSLVESKGTRCVWNDDIRITTDKSKEEIAEKLGIPAKSVVYLPQNRML